MRRRTLICVSFAVALHGAAFLALDRFWFLAATHRPLAEHESVIELVPFVPEAVTLPVVLAAKVPPPEPAPVAKPEPQPKPEIRNEPNPKPKPEVEPGIAVQLETAPNAPKKEPVVAPVTAIVSSSLTSTVPPSNESAVTTTQNASFIVHCRHSIAPVATPPAHLGKSKPLYPANARFKKQEGIVLLTVEVSAKGRALRVEVEKSSGFASLDEAAQNFYRHERFEPARLDGVPVDHRVQVPVRFQLEN